MTERAGSRQELRIGLITLLAATLRAVRRYRAPLLAAALGPFLLLLAVSTLDRWTLDLELTSLSAAADRGRSPILGPVDLFVLTHLFWDLFYFIPAALFGAGVLRLVVAGALAAGPQRFGAPRGDRDPRFLTTAMVTLLVALPLLMALRALGDALPTWAVESADLDGEHLPPIFLAAGWGHQMLLSGSLFWLVLGVVGFRLAALATAADRPGPLIVRPGALLARLLAVLLVIWVLTEGAWQGFVLATALHQQYQLLSLLKQIWLFAQTALLATAIAIAYDVTRRNHSHSQPEF